MKRLRQKLSYANVISTLCLFLLLGGGTALAAGGLAKNSVGTKQIKNNAITTAKIKNGAVSGAKLNLASLGAVPAAAHATSADTATNATNAGHADTANNATNATHAGTADDATTLQGLTPTQIAATSKLQCPTGTALSAGICMETTVRPAASLLSAFGVCAKADMVLPSMTQLWTYEEQNFAQYQPYEWVGQAYYDGTASVGAVISVEKAGGSLLGTAEPTSTQFAYRCATAPSN